MDNISHSLVGLAFAESVYQCYEKKTGEPHPLLRKCLWFLSFVANNFPDLDYLYILILGGQRLGALVHHRGHTHTLLLAVPQGLFLLFIFYILSEKKKWVWTKLQWSVLLLVSILGIWIHLGMDSLNSYGTHLFWPFDKRWYYSDTLFIVEPYLWVGFTPLLFSTAKHVLLRTVFSTLFFAIIILCWVSGLVLPELAFVVTLVGLTLALVAVRSTKTRYIHAATWIFGFVLLAVFQSVSIYAKKTVRELLVRETAGTVVHDVILSPLPANPFCWGTLVVDSLGPVTSYKIRRAITTPFPHIISLDRCFKIEMASKYLKLGKPHSVDSHLHWFGLEEFSISRFRELAKTHCGFSAWLRFARAPAFEESKGVLTVRDMRFDLRAPNFTQLEFPVNMPIHPGCALGADWEFPRQDLLNTF